jgi:hypothetical protein
MVGWMVNWKGFWRKQFEPDLRNISTIVACFGVRRPTRVSQQPVSHPVFEHCNIRKRVYSLVYTKCLDAPECAQRSSVTWARLLYKIQFKFCAGSPLSKTSGTFNFVGSCNWRFSWRWKYMLWSSEVWQLVFWFQHLRENISLKMEVVLYVPSKHWYPSTMDRNPDILNTVYISVHLVQYWLKFTWNWDLTSFLTKRAVQ